MDLQLSMEMSFSHQLVQTARLKKTSSNRTSLPTQVNDTPQREAHLSQGGLWDTLTRISQRNRSQLTTLSCQLTTLTHPPASYHWSISPRIRRGLNEWSF